MSKALYNGLDIGFWIRLLGILLDINYLRVTPGVQIRSILVSLWYILSYTLRVTTWGSVNPMVYQATDPWCFSIPHPQKREFNQYLSRKVLMQWLRGPSIIT